MSVATTRRLIAAVAALSLSPAIAQPMSAPRIGILVASTPAGYAPQVDALRAGLRDLGYVDGRNVVIDVRYANNDVARLPELAEDLVRSKPDIIVSSGPSLAPLQKATRTIPIVMAASGDAVRSGFAESFARPGGNLTGSSFFSPEVNAKRLEVLREAVPGLRRVAVLVNSSSANAVRVLDAMRSAAAALGIELHPYEARAMADLDGAFAAMARARDEALVVVDSTVLVAEAARICSRATEARLLTIGFAECARGGGALAYGVDFPALWRRAAHYVDRVLKGGKPAEMAIERASSFELIVNPAAARRAGVELPMSLRVRADAVIE